MFAAISLCSLLLLATISLAAEKVPTPETIEGATIVSAVEAKELVSKGSVAIFDMRKPMNYGRGHLPGAVSLPWKNNIDERNMFLEESLLRMIM